MTRDSPPTDDPPTPGFGLATATFVVISSMVGVGILTTSGIIVDRVGSNALMLGLWGLGGVIALCGALSLAELAAMMPRSGGEYVYLREAYGPRIAFLSGWASLLLGFAAPIAAASRAASAYLLGPIGLIGITSRLAELGLATAAILGFAAIHASARGRTARAQGVVTSIQIALLTGFAIAGIVAGRHDGGHVADLQRIAQAPGREVFFALILVSYGYTGWNASSYLAGEVADARRRLPRAIALGTLGVTGLYLALNLTYALALSAADIRSIARDEGPDAVVPIAALAARVHFGPGWSGAFSIAVGTVLLASTSAFLLTGPRVIRAMAVDGHFPAVAARLGARSETPTVATAILAGLALAILWTGSFDAMIVYSGVGLALSSILSVAAVYVLRVRRPGWNRPFRVPGYPILPAVYLAGSSAVVVGGFAREPWVSTLSALSLLVALPTYDLWIWNRSRSIRPHD